jgi:predicted lipoprotein with Yx(FWY)xxD motif
MKRILALVAGAAALALVVAACGARATAGTAPGTASLTVGTRQVPGLGTILGNAAGKPLYVNDQDGAGMSSCNGTCAAVWPPLRATGTPTAKGIAGTLSVIRRSDGTSQVALDGRPLYTFIADRGSAVAGNGFRDHYGSQHFSWHVVLADGAIPPASASPSAGR